MASLPLKGRDARASPQAAQRGSCTVPLSSEAQGLFNFRGQQWPPVLQHVVHRSACCFPQKKWLVCFPSDNDVFR